MNNIEIGKKYFEYSNISDFDKITELFSEAFTYSFQNTWLYLGAENIISMQREFHLSFESLNWKVIDMQEENLELLKLILNLLEWRMESK
jgi:hypothetical protein